MIKSRLVLLCGLAGLLFISITAQAQKIATLAGGRGDDGRLATSVSIRPAAGVFDSLGNFYFSESDFARVRKLSTNGTLSTIAGNGAMGFSGDGQNATAASLNNPGSLAIDQSGNLFISDGANRRIRKVSAQGIITTYAGNGSFATGGDGGQALLASFQQPGGIALDASGNLYVADSSARRIRRISPSGVITTHAGTGDAGSSGDGGLATDATFQQPTHLAIDTAGNLYISDPADNRIRKVGTSGVITAFAGSGAQDFSGDGGNAVSASLFGPAGVAADSAGRVYVADRVNGRIRVIGTDGIISTLAGNGLFVHGGDGGPATSASFREAVGVAISPSGDVFVTERGGGRIRKIISSGVISTIAGEGTSTGGDEGLPAAMGSLSFPSAVSVDAGGNVYIADLFNNAVRKISPSGIITTIAGGIEGVPLGDGGQATQAFVFAPRGVAADGEGNLYISAYYRIRKVGGSGIITTITGGDTYEFAGESGPATAATGDPRGLVIDAQGNIYFADTSNHRVRRISAGGTISTVAGTGVAGFSGDLGPAVSAQLSSPTGLAIDTTGRIYVAEAGSRRIRRIDSNGTIRTVAGNGTYGNSGDGGLAVNAALSNVHGVAVDAAGYLYLADLGNNRIRQVDPAGIITTIAGTGNAGFFGDGAAAAQAGLNGPMSVAAIGNSQILVADYNNNRVRKITFEAPSVPTAVQAQAGNSQATVHFLTPASNGGRAILDFTATCTTASPVGSFSATGIASPIVVTGLSNFISYTCTVAARNAVGMGPASAASTSLVPNDGPYLLSVAKTGSGTGNVTSAALGIQCDAACSASVSYGTSVTLTAVPATGSAFAGWTSAPCNGGNSGPSCTFNVAGNVTATAQFKKLLTVGPAWTGSGTLGQTVTFAQSICAGDEGIAAGQITLQYLINRSGGTVSLVVDRNGNGQVDAGEVQDWSAAIPDSIAAGTCLPVLLRITMPNHGVLGDLYVVTWGARLPAMPPGDYVQTTVHASLVRNTASFNFTLVGQGGLKYGSSVFRNVFTLDFRDPSWIEFMAVPDPGWVVAGWSGVTCANPDTSTYCVVNVPTLTQPITNFNVTLTFVESPLSTVSNSDLNDDGRSDLIWRNDADGAVQGWLMNGLSATQVAGLLPAGGYTITHVADLDGNGKADTLIRHTDGTTIGWLHDGLNVVGQATFFSAGSGWSIKHTADLNGDGKADLIVEHTDGTVVGWLMNGLTVTGTATFVPAGTGWSVSRVGDLNGDGKADLIWQNTNGTVQAWLMDGLSATQTATFVGSGTGWSVKLVGDFNGDNKSDLMWQNTDGTVQAWLMDGTAISQIASFVPAGTGWSPVLAGDIDGDGKADLFWEHTDGRSQTWLMNGLTVTNLAGFVGAGGWKATHLLDLNGDGKKDVLWKHTDGTVQGWLLNGLTITQIASLAGPGTYVVIPPRE